MAARRKPATTKRSDRTPFTRAEWQWFTTTFKTLTQRQRDAILLLVETLVERMRHHIP